MQRSAKNEVIGRAEARRGRVGQRLWAVAAVCMLAASAASATPATAVRLDQLPQQWRDDEGRAATFADWAGRRIVLTMAYVGCRKICPATIGRLEHLQRQLDARGETAEIVIVGYDPQADGPAAWRRFRARHGLLRQNWHFLSGTRDDTERFARLLGFGFWRYDDHVVHDARIVVFGADGTIHVEAAPGTSGWLALL